MSAVDSQQQQQQQQPQQNANKAANKAKWIPLARDYELENRSISVKNRFQRIDDHPLLAGWATRVRRIPEPKVESTPTSNKNSAASATANNTANKKNMTTVNNDPLRLLAATTTTNNAVFDDPLRAFSATNNNVSNGHNSTNKSSTLDSTTSSGTSLIDEKKGEVSVMIVEELGHAVPILLPTTVSSAKAQARFEPWSIKKARILHKYTTNKSIAVTANFLEEKAQESSTAAPKSVDDTARLELLEENPESEVAKQYMTQKEYIAHIEQQHENLKKAWDNGERVLSLKIAIQCAKLLGDTKVPQFYPSMYVLLTDILDTFGRLVFERIKSKGVTVKDAKNAAATATSLPDNFKSSDVCLDAKETCRNWFYKIACIRELIPRLYVDLALIKCHRFLGEDQFAIVLARLSKSIRGIGDPLIASYARAYLASKAIELIPHVTSLDQGLNPMLAAFDDFLFTYRALKKENFQGVSYVGADKGLLVDDFLDLFAPSLEWLLQCIGAHANEELFFALLQQYRDYCANSAVLVHLLAAFDAKYISKHAMAMTTLVKEAEDSKNISKARIYLTLGRALVAVTPPKNQLLPILNEIWKVVTKINQLTEYIEVADVFVEYLLQHFTDREVNIFLADVVKHAKEAASYKDEHLQKYLHSITMKVVSFSKDFAKVLVMDNFLPLLDLLEKEKKISACKQILATLAASSIEASDPVILHTLFDVARALHDSLDSMSFTDQRRQIATLIILFIRRIDFGRDLEKQLSTYVECRQAFTAIDQVTQELVLRVSLLAMQAHRFMKGKHNKKTSAFVKACLAYCHITIPSLDDVFARLRLFQTCSEVALVNQMIVQGEAFVKAAIGLIPEIPATREVDHRMRSTESDLTFYVLSFTAFLLLYPGHPENGPFYLITGLVNAIQKYEPWQKTTPNKVRVYIGLLRLFCTYSQRKFPMHILGVESNDRLYGGDDKYTEQVLAYISTIIDEIMSQLSQLGEGGDIQSRKDQGTLALELVNVIVDALEMNPHSATLTVRLYQLAQKTAAVAPTYLRATLNHLQQKKGSWYNDVAQKIMLLDAENSAATAASVTTANDNKK